MSRSLMILLSALLLVVLVLGYAAFSLVQVERKVVAAAEAEGRALLSAVSAGVERSLVASGTVERLMAKRLLELARAAGAEIAGRPGREERLLDAFASEHRLKGVLLLDDSFRVISSSEAVGPRTPATMSHTPLTTARLKPMVAADLVRRARERGLGEREEVVVGFGENPFGARVEFLVAVRVAEAGGFLLLRQDAEALRDLRRDAGVERLIAEAADSDAIAWLRLEGAGGEVLASSGSDGQGEVIEVSLPTTFEGSEGGVLRVGLDPAPTDEVVRSGRESIYLFTGLLVLLGGGGAVALALMDRAARRKRDAWERELRTRERAAAMGRLAAGVAHEVRSPLNAIGMGAQRLAREFREEPGSDTAEIVAAIRREVNRLNRTVEEFLDLGRPRPLEKTDLNPESLVRDIVMAEAPDARVDPPSDAVSMMADREELRKALGNLVRNARQAAGDAEVVVAWYAIRRDVVIEVRDGGPGVPDEEKGRIFEHFFSKRPGGTGLGLAIVRSVAERHGGILSVDDAPEGGACFRMRIPGG